MEIFESESKGVRASGYLKQNNKFVVLNGSFAVDNSEVKKSYEILPKRIEMRNKLISDGKLIEIGNKYQFTKDIEFNSPSEAASLIWGSMLNGKKVFGIGEESLATHKLYYEIDNPKAIEGYKHDKIITTNIRDNSIVKARKEKDNFTCQVCGYKMEINGKFIIECHHLFPVSLGERETKIEDLISLCPTCHRIVHMRQPIYSINEIKKLIEIWNNRLT